MKIGVIAEDKSDVEVVKALTLLLLNRTGIGFNYFVGEGCGKLRKKCGTWADILVKKGCLWVVVIHDLDNFREPKLRVELNEAIRDCGASSKVILIPCREIEAWLLYDARAIAQAFNEHKIPRVPGNPELINDPKHFLAEIISKFYRKQYINTKHNSKIAGFIDLNKLRKCASFSPLPAFVRELENIR